MLLERMHYKADGSEKRGFKTEAKALKHARKLEADFPPGPWQIIDVYACDLCGLFHIGHKSKIKPLAEHKI